jgi:hypothetical protein
MEDLGPAGAQNMALRTHFSRFAPFRNGEELSFLAALLLIILWFQSRFGL